jgi:prepilin-type N-terminal cleavage/methylation domain-containing protein/prepilin-type processing-associated H-X9-DG protein
MKERSMKRHVPRSSFRGFTLIELLVVISIVAILAALLLPALASAKERSKGAACLSNLRQIGIAMRAYADDSSGNIPFGPQAPPFISPFDLYPSTGAPTSLISLGTGQPVALGLLLQSYLASQPRVLFCPSSDQYVDSDAQLAQVGIGQAQCSYYFRHAGNTALFDNPNSPFVPTHIKLDNLGANRNGLPIRALAIDTEFLCSPVLASYDVYPSTHHQQRYADILFADGHAAARPNTGGCFVVDLGDDVDPADGFNLILSVLERADTEQ